MTPDDERRAAAVPSVPVAARMRAVADAPWVARATSATLREGADEVERLTRELADAHALARGAQYREREALGEAAVLRAREDARRDAGDPTERCPIGTYSATVLGFGAQATGDLAALARREAGPVTRHQWRQCARCGQCRWLADEEAMPAHEVRDPWGAAKPCVAVTAGDGSEGR